MYPVQQQYTPYRTGVGAVEINIYNPTVGPGGQPVPYPANGPACPPQGGPTTAPTPPVNQPPQTPISQQPLGPQPPQQPPQQTQAPQQTHTKKQVTALTDDYIKTLENYLNNPNADIRLMGTKELLKRFKEDDSRKHDQALTNLLNKALRDSSQGVRLAGLATLNSDYAYGDDLTMQILTEMQKSKSAYNQDAITASGILLKRAGQKLDIQSPANAGPAAQPVNQGDQERRYKPLTNPLTSPLANPLIDPEESPFANKLNYVNTPETANTVQPQPQPQVGQNLNVVSR